MWRSFLRNRKTENEERLIFKNGSFWGHKFMYKTDEELLNEYRNGKEAAFDEIMSRYKASVRFHARAFFLLGGEKNDLIQEGMIGLYKAVRDFDESKGAAFSTFANLCIERQIKSAVTAGNRQKNQVFSDYVSIDPGQAEEGMTFEIENPGLEVNPEDFLVGEDNARQMMHDLKDSLSAFEIDVLSRYLAGESYTAIADSMGKTSKSIDNCLQRIRQKARAVWKFSC